MKLRILCKSKIHRAVVTGADVHYVGSIGIDRDLMRLSDIIDGEQVAVWNTNTGARVETYAIELPAGSRQIVLNGAAARLFQPGDVVIIAAFCVTDEPIAPRMILVDAENNYLRDLKDGDPVTLG
jgi:aspartate 1-decarboxylase